MVSMVKIAIPTPMCKYPYLNGNVRADGKFGIFDIAPCCVDCIRNIPNVSQRPLPKNIGKLFKIKNGIGIKNICFHFKYGSPSCFAKSITSSTGNIKIT